MQVSPDLMYTVLPGVLWYNDISSRILPFSFKTVDPEKSGKQTLQFISFFCFFGGGGGGTGGRVHILNQS